MRSGVSNWAMCDLLTEDGDAVAHLDGLVDVVGDEDDGLLQLALEPEELVLEPVAGDRVDGAEGLVHQQHRGVGTERAGDTDALGLTAGELLRVAVAEVDRIEADHIEQLVDPVADLASCPSPSSFGTVAMFWAMVWCGNRPICWIT